MMVCSSYFKKFRTEIISKNHFQEKKGMNMPVLVANRKSGKVFGKTRGRMSFTQKTQRVSLSLKKYWRETGIGSGCPFMISA